jgi:hypothetical protein
MGCNTQFRNPLGAFFFLGLNCPECDSNLRDWSLQLYYGWLRSADADRLAALVSSQKHKCLTCHGSHLNKFVADRCQNGSTSHRALMRSLCQEVPKNIATVFLEQFCATKLAVKNDVATLVPEINVRRGFGSCRGHSRSPHLPGGCYGDGSPSVWPKARSFQIPKSVVKLTRISCLGH